MRAVLLSLTLPNYLLTLFALDIIFSLAKSSIRNLPECLLGGLLLGY